LSGAGDRDRLVKAVDPHHLELAHHRRAVEGDGGADARDHRVERRQPLALVMDLRIAWRDIHVAAQHVDHLHLVAARGGGFDQALGRIQAAVARKDRDLHQRLPIR
jgi:hypothetical protein